MDLSNIDQQLAQSILKSCPACFLIQERGIVTLSTLYVKSFLGIVEGDNLNDFMSCDWDDDLTDPTEDIREFQNWKRVNINSSYGDVKHMEMKTYAVKNDGRDATLTWLRDISRLVDAEDALRLVQGDVKEQSRALGEQTAKVSYELRKGLSSILGLAELLGDGELGKTQNEYLRQLKQAAYELLGCFEAAINPDDAKNADMKPLSVRQILKNLESAIRMILDKRQLKYEVLCQDDIPENLLGFPKHIQDVLVNLSKNAVGFTKEGSITIRATEHDRDEDSITLLFSVRDTGCGMPQEQVDALFPQFPLDDDESVMRYKNGGLGLTTVQTLVDYMGGRMWCKSAPGAGTTVYFTARCELAKQDDADADEFTPETETGITGTDAKILIVDDNKVNQIVACELLKRKGYTVKTADSGVEAVDIIRESGDFDLVLMDVYMPDMDGPTATKIIREMYPELPIVALTACAMPGDRDMCLSLGMNDYFTKPFEAQSFLRLVNRWTSR